MGWLIWGGMASLNHENDMRDDWDHVELAVLGSVDNDLVMG